VDVKLSYNPSDRALSHGVASLLAARPKRAMDEHMVRLKSLLEGGKTTARFIFGLVLRRPRSLRIEPCRP
jgi:hypothetical protein